MMALETNEPKYLLTEKDMDESYFIGVALAVSSSIFIGSSFILKKLSLLKLSKTTTSLRASAGGFGYLKDWIWWTGLISMAFGEFLNLIAYGFAPVSLVTPLGALSVVLSTVLASKYLQEHLNKYAKFGCVLCIIGSVVIIFNAPREVDAEYDALMENLRKGPIISYSIFVILFSFFLMCYVGPKYGNRYIFIYILLCSQVGSFTIIASKILALSIREEFEGQHVGLKVILSSLIILIICVCIQMTYLNKALDIFGASVVTPIYYLTFTTLVLLFSAILFDEWQKMTALNIIGTLVGLFIAFIAIFLLHSKKEKLTDDNSSKSSESSRYT